MTDILKNFSWQFLFTLKVFARNLLRGNRRRNTFRITFLMMAWGSNPGFSFSKPTHYLLGHGDFIIGLHIYIYNWPLQPFSQDYGLASHTTHVVFVNFICERRNHRCLTSTPNVRFLRNSFIVGLFIS